MDKRKTATVLAVAVILVILLVLSSHGTISITISNISVYIGR